MEPEPATQPDELILTVPVRGLVVLVGASGAGKSTFARRQFGPTEVLSSDAFRALIADDEADQTATPAAFEILGRVLDHRLRRGRLSVVDATNVSAGDRRGLLGQAARAGRPSVAIVLDLPEALCLERNAQRTGRTVDAAIVRRHLAAVRQTLADPGRLLAEGFARVHVIEADAALQRVRILRDPDLPRPPRPATTADPARTADPGRSMDRRIRPSPSGPRARRA